MWGAFAVRAVFVALKILPSLAKVVDTMLKTVSREMSLADQVRQQLENLIVGDSLLPGERLPSEKAMSAKMGVSRSVVREAIQQLTAQGLVEARTGSGIYVRHLRHHLVTEPMNLLLRSRRFGTEEILEVREVLEVKIAELAAERAQPADIETMQLTIDALTRSSTDACRIRGNRCCISQPLGHRGRESTLLRALEFH